MMEDNENLQPAVSLYDDLAFKVVTSKELLAMEVPEDPYIVDKLIPEKSITAITADSGKGKSLLAMIIAQSVARGEPLFDVFEVKKCKVLIIDQEINKGLIIERYHQLFKEEIDVDYIYEQFININADDNFNRLWTTISRGDYGLVIIDTLSTFHSFDENKADEMRELNRTLLQLIKDTGVTIVYLHHHRKLQRGEKFNQSSSRGSTEIIAKVASHLLVDSKRDIDENLNTVTAVTISQEKARRPEFVVSIGVDIIYDKSTNRTIWKYRGEVNEYQNKIEEAKEEVMKLLNNNEKWLSIIEIKEQINIGESSIRKACNQLVEEEKIEFQTGAGTQWNTKFYGIRKT